MSYSKNVHHFLSEAAERTPDKNALFVRGAWHSYVELEIRANQLARHMIGSGLCKGNRVAILLDNSAEYVISYFAILKAGGITVALNTECTPDDISYILGDCDIHYLITNPKFSHRVASAYSETSTRGAADGFNRDLRLFLWSDTFPSCLSANEQKISLLPRSFDAESGEPPHVRTIDLDPASIVYTSGSTGKPRGATLSHLNIVSNTRSIVDYLELTSSDRIMVILPFHYIYGKSLLNTHFFVGGSVVIDNRFLYPNVILKTMQEQETTGFAGVPSTFTILLNHSNLKSSRFPSLRYVTQAGGPMAPSVQREVADAFAPARLFIMYGATEASARLSYLDPSEMRNKWGSIGKAIPNVDLYIADENGRPLPAGVEGEIVARGSNIMSGYWNHPEETSKVLRNGLYFTGDLGRSDEEGFLYVVGRRKDMLKIGGNRVSAKEIEDALLEHPAILEAAVISLPDHILGEAPKAFVVLKSDQDADVLGDVAGFLSKHLASYKVPKSYEICESLPKNESGKILKHKLK